MLLYRIWECVEMCRPEKCKWCKWRPQARKTLSHFAYSKHLSKPLRFQISNLKNQPQIAWKGIIDFRNVFQTDSKYTYSYKDIPGQETDISRYMIYKI